MAFVTHSMGGLLTRALLRTHADLAAKTIAAVHVFQPATGAPVFYTRFHTGTVVHAGCSRKPSAKGLSA